MSPEALLAATQAILSAELSAADKADALARLHGAVAPEPAKRKRNPDSPDAIRKRRTRAGQAALSAGQPFPLSPPSVLPSVLPPHTPPSPAPLSTPPTIPQPTEPTRESAEESPAPSKPLPSAKAASENQTPPGPPPVLALLELGPPTSDPVDSVWSAYLAARRSHGVTAAPPVLTADRRAMIRKRIAETSLELVRSAGERVWLDPWASAEIGRCSPEYVWRNVERVERYASTGVAVARASTDPDEQGPDGLTDAERTRLRARAAAAGPPPPEPPLDSDLLEAIEGALDVPATLEQAERIARPLRMDAHVVLQNLERARLAGLAARAARCGGSSS